MHAPRPVVDILNIYAANPGITALENSTVIQGFVIPGLQSLVILCIEQNIETTKFDFFIKTASLKSDYNFCNACT